MNKASAWTAEEEAWLREAYPHHHNSTLAVMHAEAFPNRPRRTSKAINRRAKVYGLRKADGFVRNPPKFWTPEKDAWFASFVPGHHEAEISAEHERLYGTPLTGSQIGNHKAKLGVKSGTDGGRFRRGMEPANKGKTWDEYMPAASQERCRSTQFKKGQLLGIAKERLKEVGYERVDSKDGYIYVKVKDTPQKQEPGSFNDNFRPKHHVVYEQAHGPIPGGCVVAFADHDMRNFDPGNLVAVPRSLWCVIKHRKLQYWDAESLRLCMKIAEVDKARYAAQTRPRKCKRCGREFKPRFAGHRTCDVCLGRE